MGNLQNNYGNAWAVLSLCNKGWVVMGLCGDAENRIHLCGKIVESFARYAASAVTFGLCGNFGKTGRRLDSSKTLGWRPAFAVSYRKMVDGTVTVECVPLYWMNLRFHGCSGYYNRSRKWERQIMYGIDSNGRGVISVTSVSKRFLFGRVETLN